MSSCVHCNSCGCFPSPQQTSFCLSNCGHVYCKGCIDNGRLAVKCARCSAATPKFAAIDRSLNPDLQLLFKKPGMLVTGNSGEIEPLIKFQTTQRTMHLKGAQSQLRQEQQRRMELQSHVTTMRDQMKVMQHQFHESSHSRVASREDSRSLSRGGDASELSAHHQTMSSVGSNDSFNDPFKTPANGLKRYTTSTPKQRPMEGPSSKKMNDSSMMNSRMSHSSAIPSLASFSATPMEVDDDEIVDVTPAPVRDRSRMNTQQLLQIPPALPSIKTKNSSKMVIDSDPLLSSGVAKAPIPKTPASKKNAQVRSLSMAERLSAGPRAKTPQKVQQSEVTSSTPRPKTPTALVSSQLKVATPCLAPITPIRPIKGSHLPSSTVVSMKKTEKFNTSFKTPTLPVKKIAVARTMPAPMKTGMGGSAAAAAATSQPYM